MKSWRRGLVTAAVSATILAAPATAQTTPVTPASPTGANAPAAANTPPPAVPARQPAKPASPGIDVLDLLLTALVAAVVSAGVAYGLVRFARIKGGSTSAAAAAPEEAVWSNFEYFRGDVLDVLKQVKAKAGNLDSVPKITVNDWIKGLARARADLERAPLTKADYEPLRQLWVEVTKMGQDMSDRARKSVHGEELASSLFSFTQALSRRSQDAAKAEGAGASEGGLGKGELRRLEEQLERGSTGLVRQMEQLAGRIQKLEDQPAPSLGHMVEEEFRVLCESRAAELEQQLGGARGPSGGQKPPPPAVTAALQVAEAALKVSEEALRARKLAPGLKAQLTNLATLAGTLQAMCPVSTDQSRPPSVEAIRRLPERPEAQWQPDMVARGGSVINAVTAYWSEVNRLLQAESSRIESWLSGAGQDAGAQEAAIGEWLGSRLLPLLDQAGTAIDRDGPVRREAREGGSTSLLSALDDLHRACDRVLQGTGLEPRGTRKGDIQRPGAGVKIDHVDGGQSPETVLEVRQVGWTWNGRLLRELHVVVQEEPHAAAAADLPPAAIDPEAPAPPRPDEGGSRVRRL